MILTLLCVSIVGLQAQQQPAAPAQSVKLPPTPYALDQLDFKLADLIDGLCIVEAQGQTREVRGGGDKSSGVDRPLTADISVEKATVVDGATSLTKGSQVRLVAFDAPSKGQPGASPVAPRPKLEIGHRYLALAVKPKEARLYQPYSFTDRGYLTAGRYILAGQPDELSLLTIFPTTATELPHSGDATDRLMSALIDAMPAVQGWDRDRLNYLLDNSNGFGYDKYDPHGENQWTKKLRALAESTTDPKLRVDAYAVLVNWCVTGSEGPLFTALMDEANDPAFERKLPGNPYFVHPGEYGHPGPSYEIKYDRARANQIAASAKNEDVKRYLLEFAVTKPDRTQMGAYVRLLDTEPTWFVDRVLLRKLAEWQDLPGKEPVWGLRPGASIQEVVNRDELKRFWKGRFATSNN